MKMPEVRERAKAAGVSPGKLRKSDLIRAIQRKEGNQDCFAADFRASCGQMDCAWRQDCLVEDPR